MSIRLLLRRGLAADWAIANPILMSGELGYETDTRKLKAGDGSTSWNSLNYIQGAMWSDFEVLNGITRLRHSFANFLGNSGFESWSAGSPGLPDNWFFAGGDVVCERYNNPTQGVWACKASFNTVAPAAYSGFANSIGAIAEYVSYTFSCYYQKLSGSGPCSLYAQMGEPPWTQFAEMPLDGTIDGAWKLAMVSFTTNAAAHGKLCNFRFGVTGNSVIPSVWVFDECQVQEGLNLATTWTAAPIWDTFDQRVFGKKSFYDNVDISIVPGKGVLLSNAAGTVTKRARLNDAGNGWIFEDP